MNKPDAVTVRSPLGELEARVGVVPLEELLAERDTLVKQVAELRARHGPFGTYNDQRKVLLATVAAALRARAVETQTKMTEAAIDEASHSDGRYSDFIATATEEKAKWVELENRIDGINDTIRRGNALIHFVSQEVGLAR